jgi:hypothetical protein
MKTELTQRTESGALALGKADSLANLLHVEDSEGNWIAPRSITEQQRRQAMAILADMPRRMQPATAESIGKWLASLGVICAGSMPVEEARIKIAAYVSVLLGEFEAGCFTEGSLKRAYPKFTYGFPRGGELHAALKQEQRRLHVEHGRLRRLVNGGREIPRTRQPPTPEQIERVNAALREAGIGVSPEQKRAEPSKARHDDVSRETPIRDDLTGPGADESPGANPGVNSDAAQ